MTTQAIPPIALATPLAIWLGYGLWPKVIVAALLVFFPVFVNAHAGLTQLEPGLERLLRSLGASRLQVLRVARLPSALPLVLAALRLGATYAVIGAVFGEWVGADDGLGIYLLQANGRLADRSRARRRARAGGARAGRVRPRRARASTR